ncbi:MAG: NACHT domain-containing protein [Cyanobacteria bacterium P01_H01_bin.105]
MLENGSAIAIALLLASTEQSKPIDWSTVRTWLEGISPYPWLPALVVMVILALLFLLNVGDQLSGILSWLGVPSPFQRAQTSVDQLERTHQQLLKIVKKEVNRRLATSLHNLVKLDLYMEDQRQKVGNSKFELVPEDSEPSFQAVNRVLHSKGNKPPLALKLTQKIIEIFDRPDIQGKLLILGEPGSGKTTELLQLAQDLVTRVEEDERHPVPVILELSSWDGEPIDTWVTSQLKKLYNLSEATTQQWLAGNQILLMLDGLDELGLTKQRQCIEQINQFLETTRASELVVCCRREEYEAGEIELDGLNGGVYLEALKEDQIRRYFEELNRLSLWENVQSNSALLELAEKPLFLFMLMVAYQGKPIRSEQDLFDAYVEKQLHEPSNQGIYKPGKEPTPQKTRHYLVCLAKQLENIGETEFLIEGLQPTWLSSIRQIRLYTVTFGLIECLFMGLMCGLITKLTETLMPGLHDELTSGLISELIIGLIIGLILWLIFWLNDWLYVFVIKPKGKLQWSFWDGLRTGMLGGLITGLGYWLIFELYELLEGRRDRLLLDRRYDGLHDGLIAMLIFGLIFGLIGGLSSVAITEQETPNQGIRKSIQNALRGGLIGGLFGGLIFRLSDERSVVLLSGLLGGLLGGLDAAIQHFILRIFLTKNGDTPWNYARFLEHAVKHRFIQRTGGRYRFVHYLLRKHFAAMPLE